MEIKSVKSRKPSYPSLEEFALNSNILKKRIPSNWLKNKIVAGVLMTYLLSCSNQNDEDNNKREVVMLGTWRNKMKTIDTCQTEDNKYKVAPFFIHGDGFGAEGCIVMAAPVFLTENEARDVIFNRLAQDNLLFDTSKTEKMKFISKSIADNFIYRNKVKEELRYNEVEIKLDGYNKELNLALKFVSLNDFNKFKSLNTENINLFRNDSLFHPSLYNFNIARAAKRIRLELVKAGNKNAVVFYDPVTSYYLGGERICDKREFGKNYSEQNAKDEAKQLLLKQVEDFISWIKAEGLMND